MKRISQLIGAGTIAVAAGVVLLATSDVAAQGRGGHGGGPGGPGGGPGGGHGGGGTVVVAPYYYGGFYNPFWGPYWAPYYAGWYAPFGPYPVYADPGFGSARLQVKPNTAEVYVDGYLAGTVDNFDGAMQRLELPPGEHAITLYLDGYQTLTQNVLFRPGTSINIKYEMTKLQPGETTGPRPTPPPNAEQSGPAPGTYAAPASGVPGNAPADAAPGNAAEFGTLSVRVQPTDAVILVDGQEWSTSGSGPLTLDLPSGSHDVEVRQDGFSPYHRSVQVRPGTTTTLNVSLSR